jgi:hypothetical protein
MNESSLQQQRVFISSSRTSEAWANQLLDSLRAVGLTSWRASVDLVPGSNWAAAVSSALAEAAHVVVLVGPGGMPEFQGVEVATATQQESLGRRGVVPVLLPGADLPASLSSLNALDLRRMAPQEISRSFNELALSLIREGAVEDGSVQTAENEALISLGNSLWSEVRWMRLRHFIGGRWRCPSRLATRLVWP